MAVQFFSCGTFHPKLPRKLQFSIAMVRRELPKLNKLLQYPFPLENIYVADGCAEENPDGYGVYRQKRNTITLYPVPMYEAATENVGWYNITALDEDEVAIYEMLTVENYSHYALMLLGVLAHELRHYEHHISNDFIDDELNELDAQEYSKDYLQLNRGRLNYCYLLSYKKILGIKEKSVRKLAENKGSMKPDSLIRLFA